MNKIKTEEEFKNLLKKEQRTLFNKKINKLLGQTRVDEKGNLYYHTINIKDFDAECYVESKREYTSLNEIREKAKVEILKTSFNLALESNLFDEEILRKYFPYFDKKLLCEKQILSEYFIEEFEDEIDWLLIFKNQEHLSNQFIKKHENKIIKKISQEPEPIEGYVHTPYIPIQGVQNNNGRQYSQLGLSTAIASFSSRDEANNEENNGFFQRERE